MHSFGEGILAWKIHGQRSLVGYGPWGCKESDVTEHAHTCIQLCPTPIHLLKSYSRYFRI